MDLRMADLNGFEATRRLGADEATAAIPVMAVSASAWDEVRQAARDAGCVDFLPKPVRADVLFARLQRYTGVRFVSPAADPDAGLALEPLAGDAGVRDLASRIREAAAIGSVADLDAIAADCRPVATRPARSADRIAALTAAFDYDALLRLAASLDQEPVTTRRCGRSSTSSRTEATVNRVTTTQPAGPMASVTPLPPGDSPQTPGATILVVDDSPVNLRLVVRTLEGRGYRLLAAKNGRAALDIARRVHPDLILLDVMMPELDGFEVCRALKGDPATRDSIVVFLSALGEVTDKVTGLELGASDYITKPIQPEEVIARVANHVARQQLEREVRRSRDRLERELASAGAMQRRILPAALPAGWARRSPPTTKRACTPAVTTTTCFRCPMASSASSSPTCRVMARRRRS